MQPSQHPYGSPRSTNPFRTLPSPSRIPTRSPPSSKLSPKLPSTPPVEAAQRRVLATTPPSPTRSLSLFSFSEGSKDSDGSIPIMFDSTAPRSSREDSGSTTGTGRAFSNDSTTPTRRPWGLHRALPSDITLSSTFSDAFASPPPQSTQRNLPDADPRAQAVFFDTSINDEPEEFFGSSEQLSLKSSTSSFIQQTPSVDTFSSSSGLTASRSSDSNPNSLSRPFSSASQSTIEASFSSHARGGGRTGMHPHLDAQIGIAGESSTHGHVESRALGLDYDRSAQDFADLIALDESYDASDVATPKGETFDVYVHPFSAAAQDAVQRPSIRTSSSGFTVSAYADDDMIRTRASDETTAGPITDGDGFLSPSLVVPTTTIRPCLEGPGRMASNIIPSSTLDMDPAAALLAARRTSDAASDVTVNAPSFSATASQFAHLVSLQYQRELEKEKAEMEAAAMSGHGSRSHSRNQSRGGSRPGTGAGGGARPKSPLAVAGDLILGRGRSSSANKMMGPSTTGTSRFSRSRPTTPNAAAPFASNTQTRPGTSRGAAPPVRPSTARTPGSSGNLPVGERDARRPATSNGLVNASSGGPRPGTSRGRPSTGAGSATPTPTRKPSFLMGSRRVQRVAEPVVHRDQWRPVETFSPPVATPSASASVPSSVIPSRGDSFHSTSAEEPGVSRFSSSTSASIERKLNHIRAMARDEDDGDESGDVTITLPPIDLDPTSLGVSLPPTPSSQSGLSSTSSHIVLPTISISKIPRLAQKGLPELPHDGQLASSARLPSPQISPTQLRPSTSHSHSGPSTPVSSSSTMSFGPHGSASTSSKGTSHLSPSHTFSSSELPPRMSGGGQNSLGLSLNASVSSGSGSSIHERIPTSTLRMSPGRPRSRPATATANRTANPEWTYAELGSLDALGRFGGGGEGKLGDGLEIPDRTPREGTTNVARLEASGLGHLKNVFLMLTIDQEHFREIHPKFIFNKLTRVTSTPGTGSGGSASVSPTLPLESPSSSNQSNTPLGVGERIVEFKLAQRQSYAFHYATLDTPPTLRRLLLNGDPKRDFISREAALILKKNGVWTVRGTEDKSRLSWQFTYLVDDRRGPAGEKINGEKMLTPLTFSCTPELLSFERGRKIGLLQVARKALLPRLSATKLDPPALAPSASSAPTKTSSQRPHTANPASSQTLEGRLRAWSSSTTVPTTQSTRRPATMGTAASHAHSNSWSQLRSFSFRPSGSTSSLKKGSRPSTASGVLAQPATQSLKRPRTAGQLGPDNRVHFQSETGLPIVQAFSPGESVGRAALRPATSTGGMRHRVGPSIDDARSPQKADLKPLKVIRRPATADPTMGNSLPIGQQWAKPQSPKSKARPLSPALISLPLDFRHSPTSKPTDLAFPHSAFAINVPAPFPPLSNISNEPVSKGHNPRPTRIPVDLDTSMFLERPRTSHELRRKPAPKWIPDNPV